MFRLAALVTATAAVWLLAGCQSLREYPAVPAHLAIGAARNKAHIETPIRFADHEFDGEEDRNGSSKNILVLSGGGMNGAFSAGMLNGWTQSGQRPEFDIVTGVSTGALVAPFAFLGEEYDDQLKHLYTSDSAAQIYKILPVFLWNVAAASSEPLRRQIQQTVTANLLDQIAQEHRRGRRLYFGTTNLDTQKPVVWDIGAIAAGDDPHKVELVQNVMLASCSVPGLLPPIGINVEIEGQRYTELHVDGGVSASMFLPPQAILKLASEGDEHDQDRDMTVYTIVAGKADPDPVPVKQGLLHLSGASLSSVLRAQLEHELTGIYLLAYFANANFRLAAIPPEFTTSSSSMEFDLKTMRILFDEGYRLGAAMEWSNAPPGIDPDQWIVPRAGTRLVSNSDTPVASDTEQ